METGKELFESIMNSCPRKKVVSLCKKFNIDWNKKYSQLFPMRIVA